MIVTATARGSRIAFLLADLGRRFGRDNLPDHGDLLAKLVRWAAKDGLLLALEGPGLIDCHLYRQPGRAILHLVTLTNVGTWRQPVHELIPVGPLWVLLKLPEGVRGKSVHLLVSGQKSSAAVAKGWSRFQLTGLTIWAVVGSGTCGEQIPILDRAHQIQYPNSHDESIPLVWRSGNDGAGFLAESIRAAGRGRIHSDF